MSYQLGNVTLPSPKSFVRDFIETAQENLLMEGRSTKKVTNRKEKFTLIFQNLTQLQINNILSEFELEQVRSFTIDETSLNIGPTDVLVDIGSRQYPSVGRQYRENLTLILTEVK